MTKVNVYLVSYDENGNRVETPWENLTKEEQKAWHGRALDRMANILGYRRLSAEETAAALATGDYITL